MIHPRVSHPSPYGQQAQCVIVASSQLFDFDQLECFCLLSARQWGVILLEAFGYCCLLIRFEGLYNTMPTCCFVNKLGT
jgi:hypothetical protein